MIGVLICVVLAFAGLQLLQMAANTAVRRGQSVWHAAKVELFGGLYLLAVAFAGLAAIGGWL